MKPVHVAVLGALGRMGQAIQSELFKDPGFEFTWGLTRSLRDVEDKTALGKHIYDSLENIADAVDVVIDVTRADAVKDNLAWIEEEKIPYVLAVTGMDETIETQLKNASQKTPIVVAPNLSYGIAALNELLQMATKLLPEADIEIVETHHRFKKDAPSGTANQLAKTVVDSAGDFRWVYPGTREIEMKEINKAVCVHSLRGGDVVGEHLVKFFLDGERIELNHIASSRSIFARGALRAAKFVVDQKPGLYSMQDVVKLERNQK